MSELADRSPSGATTPRAAEPSSRDELDRLWADPKGLVGRLRAVQNDAIGGRLLLTGFFFVLLGGSGDSVAMRLQLAQAENGLIGPGLYNELFTNHGSVTMFLVILPIFEGFAILLLPSLLGSREMPFPRLGAFSYFTFVMGGLLYYSSTLFQLVPNNGWFAYVPLSGPEFSPGMEMDFWVLGLGVAEVGAIAAAIEISIGILKMRGPGMTLGRIPLFAWAMLVTAFMILFAFIPLIVGSLLLELDRGFSTEFFNVEAGGSALLWQHLFWIFGHPEVYIQFLPAAGIVSMIIPVFARRRIVGYPWVVGAFVAIAFLSFGLWAHHMFTVGLPPLVLSFFAASSIVIGIPAGVQMLAWVATIWAGRPVWKTPFLFCIGFLILFVLGGITGIMVASVPFDAQAHDTYFVVGHLHYVLIGGVVFPIFAGIYYWWPKFTGKMYDERLGRWTFWILFVGVNVAFFPMHIVGLMGMPRRVYTYPAGLGWDVYNLISTIGVLIILPGIGLFVLSLVRSWFRGEPAGANPWGADTLEWSIPSPPAQHQFTALPLVRSRHPLWDQDTLDRGDPQLERFARGIGEWPLRWRAAVVVGTSDGRPQEVFRVAGPSLWPLFTAIGVVVIFAAELFHLRWAIGFGVLIIAIGAIMWNRPEEAPMTEEEETAFEREHGVPVHAGGSIVVARWGMGMAVLALGIAFACFLLTYFYLRLENPVWPPPGFAVPSLLPGLAAAGLVTASVAPMQLALRRIRRGDVRGLGLGLAAALAALVAALVVQLVQLASLDFGWAGHAYGSVFYTLAGFVVAVAVAGAVMAALTLVWAVRGYFSSRRHTFVLNVSTYWLALAAIWVLGFATLLLAPRVT